MKPIHSNLDCDELQKKIERLEEQKACIVAELETAKFELLKKRLEIWAAQGMQ